MLATAEGFYESLGLAFQVRGRMDALSLLLLLN